MMTKKKAAPKKAATKTASKAAPKKAASSRGNAGVRAEEDAAEGLRELFIEELKDIYWAEKALTKALPKMAKNATDQGLADALNEHLEITLNQITRVEQVFEMLEEKAQAKKCEAMAGLVAEAEEIMKGTQKGVVRDAGIISACQKVEHYEIASYGTLTAFAKTLGEDEAADVLAEILDEEKEADSILTTIAESAINVQAAEEDDEEEGEDEE